MHMIAGMQNLEQHTQLQQDLMVEMRDKRTAKNAANMADV
jgi:hypothetical protein